jgi:hypothetical protein
MIGEKFEGSSADGYFIDRFLKYIPRDKHEEFMARVYRCFRGESEPGNYSEGVRNRLRELLVFYGIVE